MNMLSRSIGARIVRRVLSAGFFVAVVIASLCHGNDSGTAEASSSQANQAKLVDFARDIAPLLQSRCASCHEGDAAKNGFAVGDRTAMLGIIEAGSSANSSLWTDYLTQPSKAADQESLVMPPDGPLSTAELSLLKLWIDEGAEWPENATLNSKSTPAAPDESYSLPQRIFLAAGYFHPAVVHFPIALYSIAALGVIATYLFGKSYRAFAIHCLLWAALFGVFTAVLGWSFAESRGYPSWDTVLSATATPEQTNFFFHRWLGSMTCVGGIVVVLIAWAASRRESKFLEHFWRLGCLSLALLVGVVGHQGGALIYGDLLGKAISQLKR